MSWSPFLKFPVYSASFFFLCSPNSEQLISVCMKAWQSLIAVQFNICHDIREQKKDTTTGSRKNKF